MNWINKIKGWIANKEPECFGCSLYKSIYGDMADHAVKLQKIIYDKNKEIRHLQLTLEKKNKVIRALRNKSPQTPPPGWDPAP